MNDTPPSAARAANKNIVASNCFMPVAWASGLTGIRQRKRRVSPPGHELGTAAYLVAWIVFEAFRRARLRRTKAAFANVTGERRARLGRSGCSGNGVFMPTHAGNLRRSA